MKIHFANNSALDNSVLNKSDLNNSDLNKPDFAANTLLARHQAIQARAYHSQGEHIAVSAGEALLTPLHRWQRMVAHAGNQIALEEEGHTLTYAALNAQANRLAHVILARNLAHDAPVAMLFELEWDLPLAILAIWKAGHFFLWLEGSQPFARNQYMLAEAEAPLVITNRSYAATARELCGDAGRVLVIEEIVLEEIGIEAEDARWPASDPPILIDGSSRAYLMYTSGSTGKPKGTVELQRNLMQMMIERTNPLQISQADRVAFLVLGGGCFTLVCALMYGATLLPFPAKYEGLARLAKWVVDQRITVLIDAAMLRTWLLTLDGSVQFPSVRLLILGAGPSYREHLLAYQRYLPAQAIFVNLYAATEVRSIALLFMDQATAIETRLIPVGYPPPWAQIEIWDEQDKALLVDQVGEIVIFTPYAAAGYWKAPESTAAKFGVDAHGRRFCRMGDLGKIDEQGCLWVLGRRDGQLKIRDNRVEIAEVEVSLMELPDVLEAAVIALGAADESQRLVAFVTTQAAVSGAEVRRQLAERLPDYMLPATIIVQPELPRNANGKVARPLLRQIAMALSSDG